MFLLPHFSWTGIMAQMFGTMFGDCHHLGNVVYTSYASGCLSANSHESVGQFY
jgi:hypothetical protein